MHSSLRREPPFEMHSGGDDPSHRHEASRPDHGPGLTLTRDAASQEPAGRTPVHFISRLRFALQDRKVIRWLLAYLGGTWVLLEAIDVLSGIWSWPLSLQRIACLTLGLGFLPALVLAWFHGEKGRQRVSCWECLLLSLVLVGSAAVLRSATVRGVGGGTATATTTAVARAEPCRPGR